MRSERLWHGWVIVAAVLQATHAREAREFPFPVVFPLASSDSRIAAERTAARADAVIRSQACGREPTFFFRRAQVENGDYEVEGGEGFASTLIAKIHWLRTRSGPCDWRLVFKTEEEPNPVGPEQDRLEAFVNSHLEDTYLGDYRWRDPAVNCAASTSNVAASIVTEKIDEDGVKRFKRFYQLSARFHVERECLRQQVNQAIRLMKQNGRMGTKQPVCFASPGIEADFDMTVKEVVRILYLSGAAAGSTAILDADTVAHMYRHLLPARGSLGPANFHAATDCADTAGEALGTPEEYADQQDTLAVDFLDALGDAAGWLATFVTKVAAVMVTVANAGAVAAVGWFLVHGTDDTVGNVVYGPFDLSIPETENHRLMIESSRYLTNRAIILDLKRRGGHDNLDLIVEQQKEVREWLLKDLQRIAIHDFDEYNARPYTRMSLDAIQNLYDFANDEGDDRDPQMQAAARIVLDLSSAKFAAGSNRGRRIVPYRRKAEYDGSDGSKTPNRHLYIVIEGSDYEVTRQLLLAGQTQPMERVEKGPKEAEPDAAEIRSGAEIWNDEGIGNMVNTATSSYRLPVPIMEVATERVFPFEQVVQHAGIEIYYNHPAYTMSVGGVRRPAALSMAFGPFTVDSDNDNGIAMPTTLIPTLRGTLARHTFQFRGAETQDDRVDNLCGWRGFICGINPVFGDMCGVAQTQPDGTTLHFLNSASPNMPVSTDRPGCQPEGAGRRAGPHFFLAARRGPCREADFCPDKMEYGVMEIVAVTTDKAYSEDAFRDFCNNRAAALMAWSPNHEGDGTYRTMEGDTIEFRVAESGGDQGHSQLWKVNGVVPYTSGVTNGAVIKQLSPEGKASITSPWSGAHIDIDFTDWGNPRISDVPAPPGGRSQLYRVSADGRVTWQTHWRVPGLKVDGVPLQAPKTVNRAWDKYVLVTAAIGSPVVYAMDAAGDLWWFRHDGIREGSDRWRGPIKVGNGWTIFDKIIAGENGEIYGRLPDGQLRWYHHLGYADGSLAWAAPENVDTGWQEYIDIFAGSNGVIYGIKPNGDLIWHRHLGHQTGAAQWERRSPVGNGWANITARSVGDGVIYAITPDGELHSYRHQNPEEGEYQWDPDVVLDRGWGGGKHFFVLRPGE